MQFSAQDAKKSLLGGSSKTIRLFIDFWTQFLRILVDVGSQVGSISRQFRPIVGCFGRLGGSWGRPGRPCSPVGSIVADFLAMFNDCCSDLG